MKAGQHFLTDVLLGYGMGFLSGYFIPELHKKENSSFSFKPIMYQNFYGESYQGLSLSYQF